MLSGFFYISARTEKWEDEVFSNSIFNADNIVRFFRKQVLEEFFFGKSHLKLSEF